MAYVNKAQLKSIYSQYFLIDGNLIKTIHYSSIHFNKSYIFRTTTWKKYSCVQENAHWVFSYRSTFKYNIKPLFLECLGKWDIKINQVTQNYHIQ